MNEINLPLVTIGVASYNNGKYIKETLNSILDQSYQNIEIVINEDCSKDNSLEVIRDWLINDNTNTNVKLLINEKNKGLCNSLNNIIKNSNGEFISLIASDDKYLPDFVKNRVEYLKKTEQNIGMCYSKTYLINEKSERTGIEEREKWLNGDVFEDFCALNNSFLKPLTSMVKRDVYDTIGLYDENLLYEDLDFMFRLTQKYYVDFIDSIDTEYRVLEGSLGAQLNTTERGLESNSMIIRKNFGFSKIADKNLAIRLRKVAVNKRKMKINSWKDDFKIYLKYMPTLRDKFYYYIFSLIS
jgi:glycosyltransferase involved in cell wall biosynthesis